MEIFGTLAIIAVIIWVFAKLENWQAKAAERDDQREASQATTANRPEEPSAGASPPPRRRLAIEGTEQVVTGYGFVKAFSLPPALVTDVARRKGPGSLASFPTALQDTLKLLYEHGCLHGLEIIELLFKGADLPEGQALYFAMVSPPNQPAYVVGFIDKDSR